MTLNRPALALGSGPRGVHDARRWIASGLRDLGRADLVETAEIATSELVTNALLHGQAPIQVTLRGTRDHPRVEVRDGSRERPVMPEPFDPEAPGDLDDLLMTFGRGLGIVARAAAAWGADIDDDGKVVWFTPNPEMVDEGVEGAVTGVEDPRPGAEDADRADLVVERVPVAPYLSFQRHYRELRREVRLLALAHEQDYPLAKTLSDLFGSLERVLRHDLGSEQVERARDRGETVVDLHVSLRNGDEQRLERLSELLDLADAFCREERLLSVARTREQESFQRWFLGEVLNRAAGEPSSAWQGIQGSARGPAGTSGLPHARSSVS